MSSHQEQTNGKSATNDRIDVGTNLDIRICKACLTPSCINGIPVGHHTDVLGECVPDRMNLHYSDIRLCNVCCTPNSINGIPVGHHTDNYDCIPDPRFLGQSHRGYFYQSEIVPVISGSFDGLIPCRKCMEVMVPNPVNSDAIGCGYCADCWDRR